jgi:hypothetical protein
VLAQGQHQVVRLELFELTGRLREAGLVQLHLLDQQLALVRACDRAQPAHRDAFLQRLGDLAVVGGHPVPGPAVYHHGLGGAKTARCAGGVHGRVPAAVDGDPAAEHRSCPVFPLIVTECPRRVRW